QFQPPHSGCGGLKSGGRSVRLGRENRQPPATRTSHPRRGPGGKSARGNRRSESRAAPRWLRIFAAENRGRAEAPRSSKTPRRRERTANQRGQSFGYNAFHAHKAPARQTAKSAKEARAKRR